MKKVGIKEEFLRQYKALNKDQKEAVDAVEGPVMVIAGPGTGKTTILTLRIANILDKTDTPASGILALTFTESGVKSMKSKLRKIIGERADEVRIYTFHGFASAVISEFPDHFPHLSRSKQITDIESNSIAREIIADKKYSKLRPFGEPDYYINKIIGAISDAKKEAFGPTDLEKFARLEVERIKEDPNSISTRGASKGQMKAESLTRIEKCEKTILLAKVFEEYEKRKKEQFKMDFDDLLYELLLALKNDELLLRSLQEKFLYILVDEHQDTNDSQNLIVSYLANFFESPNLFVVGDEKQAIYRFQGASVENFLKFQNTWRDMKIISLRDNYRSHQAILDATFSMIESNYEGNEHEKLRVKLKSGTKGKERPIDLVVSKDINSQNSYLMEEISKISKAEPEATVAIILRWNRDIDDLLSLSRAKGIQISAERGVDIFSHPFGVAYFNLLELVDNPENLEALAISVATCLWGLKLDESVQILKQIKTGNIKDVYDKLPEFVDLQRKVLDDSPISFLIELARVSNLATESRLKDPVVAEVWRAIVELAKEIATGREINDTKTLVKELLSYKITADSKNIKISSGGTDSKIQIMTAHSSKGLEFDYVFIPFALEEYWIRRNKGSSFILPKEREEGDSIKDSRRLFYVSLTRARKHAVIITPQKSDLGDDFLNVRFVDELDKDRVRVLQAKTEAVPNELSLNFVSEESKQRELIEYTKRVLLERGISVTALNHYLKCPNQFLFKSILKIPEAPNPISEKGIAMHKAISEVWRNKDKSASVIKKVIDSAVKAYLETSLISKSERELILEELVFNSDKVAESLHEHFVLVGQVATDKWLDRVFTTKVSDEEVEVTLHGQMDAIIHNEKETRVFDYKTKEGMTSNQIKGLTKSSDGAYFRQLVFYKILTENNPLY
ncbi:MAG: ATP-dependent DNA helicase, partial [Minisyncoccia bacterium]